MSYGTHMGLMYMVYTQIMFEYVGSILVPGVSLLLFSTTPSIVCVKWSVTYLRRRRREELPR